MVDFVIDRIERVDTLRKESAGIGTTLPVVRLPLFRFLNLCLEKVQRLIQCGRDKCTGTAGYNRMQTGWWDGTKHGGAHKIDEGAAVHRLSPHSHSVISTRNDRKDRVR